LRPRYQPQVEHFEDRTVPSATTVVGSPNPGTPDVPISFSVTIKTTNPNDTDLQGNVTVVIDSQIIDQRNNIFIGGVPGTPIMFQFTDSAKLAFGDHTIVVSFNSTDPGEPSSSGQTVEHIPMPDDIEPVPDLIKPFFTTHLKHHRIKQVVKITDPTSSPTSGNLFLVVDGLNPNITLEGAAGVTKVHPPLDSPFVALGHRQIKPHKSIKVTLFFDDPMGLALHDKFRLLEGTTML
jgi:hypothetical protein